MRHFIKYKWFWLTLGGWCFIASLSAWASIFSPFNPVSKPFLEFTAQINHRTEENKFYKDRHALEQTMATITEQWEAGGWQNMSGKINIASVFLDSPAGTRDYLSAIAQIRLFQKEGSYRLMCLLRTPEDRQTYQWVSEIQKSSFENPDLSQDDFPITPSQGAKNVSLIKSKRMESLIWATAKNNDFKSKFHALCLSRGFIQKPIPSSPESSGGVYFLEGRNALIMTTISEQGENFIISMVKVARN